MQQILLDRSVMLVKGDNQQINNTIRFTEQFPNSTERPKVYTLCHKINKKICKLTRNNATRNMHHCKASSVSSLSINASHDYGVILPILPLFGSKFLSCLPRAESEIQGR